MSSDIQEQIKKYINLTNDIAKITKEKKALIEKRDAIGGDLQTFMREKEREGIKYQNIVIYAAPKVCRAPKKKDAKFQDILGILQNEGIKFPEKITTQIIDCQKGDVLEKMCIKIKNVD